MKGTVSFARFERKLRSPFRYGNRSVDTRSGFLLRKQVHGELRFAEASPLPGHSAESLEDVSAALRDHVNPPPSLRFALDSLERSSEREFSPVRSNALLTWTNSTAAHEELGRFRALKYTHCKLKIGPEITEELADLIDAHSSFFFRLDANRSLSPASLDKLLKQLDRRSLLSRIDYLEEPFEDIWKDPDFRNAPLAFAADESAANAEAISSLLREVNPPRTIVLKPTVQGSLDALTSLADSLKARKVRPIFTSALETEIGRRSIISFLSNHPSEVAGLSTGFLFDENRLEDRPLWNEIPAITPGEQAWLDSLSWTESRW